MSEQTAFSVPQVAARWGVSSRQVYDLCSRGELGHLRIGGLIRFRLADLEAYEARQWHAPSSISPTTASSSAEVVFMSAGGRVVRGSAFQRGRKTAGAHSDSSPNS
jgi:excisionase family DNA binding protein